MEESESRDTCLGELHAKKLSPQYRTTQAGYYQNGSLDMTYDKVVQIQLAEIWEVNPNKGLTTGCSGTAVTRSFLCSGGAGFESWLRDFAIFLSSPGKCWDTASITARLLLSKSFLYSWITLTFDAIYSLRTDSVLKWRIENTMHICVDNRKWFMITYVCVLSVMFVCSVVVKPFFTYLHKWSLA